MNELEKLVEVVRFLIKDQDAHKKANLTIADRRLRKALSDYDNRLNTERDLACMSGQAQSIHINDAALRAQNQKVTPEQAWVSFHFICGGKSDA